MPWEDLRLVDAAPRRRSVRNPRRAPERPDDGTLQRRRLPHRTSGRGGRYRPGGAASPARDAHLRAADRRGPPDRGRTRRDRGTPGGAGAALHGRRRRAGHRHPRRDVPRRRGGPVLDDAHRRRAGQARRRLPRPGAAGRPPVHRRGDDGGRGRARPAPRRAHRRHRARRRGRHGPHVGRAARRRAAGRRLPDLGRVARAVALHLGHHRHAQGRDAPPHRHPLRLRDLRPPGAGHRPRRRLPLGREALLRLRPGQQPALPARRWARARCWSPPGPTRRSSPTGSSSTASRCSSRVRASGAR